MKYIFRYTILSQYTANPDNLKPQDLIETLKSTNFSQGDKIDAILETSRLAIDSLIKSVGKSTQSNQ